ncbi:hypothetical protein [Nonomuraea sp. NPDC003214]
MADVTAEQVAIRAGLSLPVDEGMLPVLAEAIASGYRTAAGYLMRPAKPTEFTQRGVAAGPYGWLLDQDPVLEIVSAVPEVVDGYPTGRWTVVYRAGLDPDGDPSYGAALTEYVIAHAAESGPVQRLAQAAGARLHKSVSVEGQAVTYESSRASAGSGAGSGSGVAGAPPTLDSLSPWRVVAVAQRPGIGPHPAQTGAAWRL